MATDILCEASAPSFCGPAAFPSPAMQMLAIQTMATQMMATQIVATSLVKEEPQDVMEPVEESPELLREQLTDSAVSIVLKKTRGSKKNKKSAPKKGLTKKIFSDPSRCDICGKILVDKTGLRRHLLVHTGERPYECGQCSRRFTSAGNARKHEANVHAKVRRVPCTQCPASFATQYHLRAHMPVHTGEKPYACTKCDKRYARPDVLKMHMYTHTGEKPFACSMCAYACRDHSTLRRHEQRHAGTLQTYQCRICLKRCGAKWRLKLHVASVHLQADVTSRYQCHECGKRFKMRALIVRHLQNVHMKLRQFACEVCGRLFTSLGNMRVHVASHSTLRPHVCARCGLTFKTQGDLYKHSKLHSVARFACGDCGRGFHRPAHLARHERTHRPRLKLTPCPHCHVCFYNQRYVDKHVRTVHDKDRTMYECDHCGYTVKNKPAMVSHLRRHGSKRYRCGECGKRFRRATPMKRHCRLEHGVLCTTRFHKRKKNTPSIKEEPLDIEENALPEPVEDEGSEAMAAREIRSSGGDVRRVPEHYFDDYYILKQNRALRVKEEGEPLKQKDAVLTTVGAGARAQPAVAAPAPPRPAPAPSNPPPPPPLRLRRSAPPVNYNELANPKFEEESLLPPPQPPLPPPSDRTRAPDEATAPPTRAVRGRGARGRGGGARGSSGAVREGGAARPWRPSRYVSKCSVKLDVRQCYTCFKLFPTDEALTLHCREHYPAVPLAAHNGVADTEQHESPERSVRYLNREKSKDIDRSNRAQRLRSVLKRKLVRRGGEWAVESEPVAAVVVAGLRGDARAGRPLAERARAADPSKEDLRRDEYLEKMVALSRKAKALGKSVLFPCDKCPRVCRMLCGLRLHRRLHDTHARPYRPKRWLNRRVASQTSTPPPKPPPPSTPPPRANDRSGQPRPIPAKNYRCDESLKRFFKRNITGTDVDFEHFLREYRKVERGAEPQETNAWGVVMDEVGGKVGGEAGGEVGGERCGLSNGPPGEGTGTVRRILNVRREKKRSVVAIRKESMRRRFEMREELRRKLAARSEHSVEETGTGKRVTAGSCTPTANSTDDTIKL